MNDIYEEYAILDAKEKALKASKDILRVEILKDMIARGVEKEKHSLGGFSVAKLKSWTYPEKVAELNEKFKTAKAKAESNGDATFTESDSLRFNKINI